MRLKSLNCDFLSDEDILMLNTVNIQTSEQFVTHNDLEALSKSTKIPLRNLKMIKKFIIGHYSPFPEPGDQVLRHYLKKLLIIPTGCKQIDKLIANGIYSSEITELTGPTCSGKTQFCLNLIVNMYKSHPNYSCVYIDSKNNFCEKRILNILTRNSNYSEDNELVTQILKSLNIIYCKDIFYLIDILFRINKSSSSSTNLQTHDIKNENELKAPNLLIIDDIKSIFTSLFAQNNYSDLNYYLSYISSHLKYLATYMNIAIVVTTNTNQTLIDANNVKNFNNIFDNFLWKSVPNLVMHLTNCEDTDKTRKCKIVKINRPCLNLDLSSKQDYCYFNITDFGLQ